MENDNFDDKLTKEEIESKKKDDWLNFLRVRYDFPEEYDLIKKSELKRLNSKRFFSGILTGIFVFLGLLLIAGVFLYLGNGDKLKSEITCLQNVTIPKCPDIPFCPVIPSCPSCSLSCGNTTITPIVYTNSS